MFNEYIPTSINKMIRRFVNEKNEQKQTKIILNKRARSTTTSSVNSPARHFLYYLLYYSVSQIK